MERRQPLLHRIGEAGAKFGTKPPRSKRVRLAIQLGIAVIVFGFMYLFLVEKMGRRFKEAAQMARASWAAAAFVARTPQA